MVRDIASLVNDRFHCTPLPGIAPVRSGEARTTAAPCRMVMTLYEIDRRDRGSVAIRTSGSPLP
jgi:hypothetical protein